MSNEPGHTTLAISRATLVRTVSALHPPIYSVALRVCAHGCAARLVFELETRIKILFCCFARCALVMGGDCTAEGNLPLRGNPGRGGAISTFHIQTGRIGKSGLGSQGAPPRPLRLCGTPYFFGWKSERNWIGMARFWMDFGGWFLWGNVAVLGPDWGGAFFVAGPRASVTRL